jgi:hypothetical protein
MAMPRIIIVTTPAGTLWTQLVGIDTLTVMDGVEAYQVCHT